MDADARDQRSDAESTRSADDGKARARRTWGSSPTGWTSAGEHQPGTPEYFQAALRFRDRIEQPWLPEVVPFERMRSRRVLEIGFGPGFDALTIIRNGARYRGIDLTPENVERTRRHLAAYGLEPDVQVGDAEALPFEDGAFDMVFSNGVLHHVPSIERAFAEAHRVLAPGGEFFVLVYHRNSIFYRVTLALWSQFVLGGWRRESLRERLSRIEANAAGERPIVNVYGRRELRRLLLAAGFQLASIRVRKLTWHDLPNHPAFNWLLRRVPQRWYDVLGRVVGWYLIAHAQRPG